MALARFSGEQVGMFVDGAEGILEHPSSLEEEVRGNLPGKAHATVNSLLFCELM